MARDRRVTWTACSTAATGVLGWLAMVVVGRAETPADFAGFAALWGLFFGFGGAFAGLQHETTRAVSRLGRRASTGAPLAAVLALSLPVAGSAAWVASSHLEDGHLSAGGGGSTAFFLGLLGLAVLTYVCGVLVARDRWSRVAAMMVADAVVRTALVGCAAVTDRPGLYAWALGAAPWVALLAVSGPSALEVFALRGDARARRALGRAAGAMTSAAGAALLVAGFPLLVDLARPAPLDAEAGTLLATLVLVRSPLLVVVYGMRPVVLRSLLDGGVRARSRRRWMGAAALAGLGACGALAAVGPWLVATMLGPDYAVSRVAVVVLAAGGVLVAGLVVTGLALVARDRQVASSAGWMLAVCATVATLVLVHDPSKAVLWAVLVGPVSGWVLHVAVLATPRAPRPVSGSRPA